MRHRKIGAWLSGVVVALCAIVASPAQAQQAYPTFLEYAKTELKVSGVEIIYETPNDELVGVSIRPGSILLKDVLSDGILSGRARLSSSKCGNSEHEVGGLFDPSSQVPFFLREAASQRGSDCTAQRWVETGGTSIFVSIPHERAEVEKPSRDLDRKRQHGVATFRPRCTS